MAKCSELIKALDIIGKYVDLKKEWVSAEHDIIYLPLHEDTEISDEDRKALDEIGCIIAEEAGTWAMFT